LKYSGSPASWPDANQHNSTKEDIDDIPDSTPSDLSTSTDEKKQPVAFTKPMPPKEDMSETVKRQVGDWGVWLYYGKAIGVLPILLLTFYCSTATVGSNFPRKYPSFFCSTDY
jgi:hypothetical protein